MSIALIVQLLLVLIFGIAFWRSNQPHWGIGLLTVAVATVVSSLISLFGFANTFSDFGIWSYLIGGLIFLGAGIWGYGVARPVLGNGAASATSQSQPTGDLNNLQNWRPDETPLTSVTHPSFEDDLSLSSVSMAREIGDYDLQLLHDQIRINLGPDDVLDLAFDLEMAENDVVSPTRDMRQTILNIIHLAVQREQTAELALAIERILTPVPPDHFPRLEMIRADSPPTILRRYLLAFYFMDDIQKMSDDLEVDWERLALGSKQAKVRSLLRYLQRRNRVQELIERMQANKRKRRIQEADL